MDFEDQKISPKITNCNLTENMNDMPLLPYVHFHINLCVVMEPTSDRFLIYFQLCKKENKIDKGKEFDRKHKGGNCRLKFQILRHEFI